MMTEKSETPSLLLTQLSLDVNRALSGQRLLYNTPEGLRVKELYERAEKAEAENAKLKLDLHTAVSQSMELKEQK